jgi:ribonuclease E
LEKELETTIAVRVNPALHPEKFRIEELADQSAAVAPPPNLRVGDELEVELVHARLPVVTSALAIIGDRLVEVENAANAAGETLKIKVIDIDEDGTILAEPRTHVVQLAAEAKKRRRRGGRGRKKELTPAEQEEQLRELAEEAAKGVGARPALGISTTAEAEAEDAETRAHTATSPPIATVTPLHAVPEYAAVDPNGEGRTYASYGGPADGEGRRRRRRRRRRRGGPAEAANGVAPSLTAVPDGSTVSPLQAPVAGEEGDADLEGDEEEVSAAPSAGEEGQVRKRRRRRRRRGRGGLPVDGAAGSDAAPAAAAGGRALPDRQIFRVNGAGAAEPTGETAPPEPVRAIAAVEVRSGAVAVEAPPAILTVPDSTPVTQVAKPARRRRKADDLDAPQLALPSPTPEEAPAPKKRGRPRKVVADAPAAVVPQATGSVAVAPALDEAPKRRGRKPKAEGQAETRVAAAKASPAPVKTTAGSARTAAASVKPAAASAKPAAAKAKAPVRRTKADAPAPTRAAAAKKTATRGKKTTAKKAASTSTRKKTTTTSRKKKSS